MELKDVIRFLVTIMRTIKEKDIAIAMPYNAEVTNAFSTLIDVQAEQVCLPFNIFGASFIAFSLISLMYVSHLRR